MANIPILGQPCRVLVWYPTAVILCKCQGGEGQAKIVITTGFNNASACGVCGTLYMIRTILPPTPESMGQPVLDLHTVAPSTGSVM